MNRASAARQSHAREIVLCFENRTYFGSIFNACVVYVLVFGISEIPVYTLGWWGWCGWRVMISLFLFVGFKGVKVRVLAWALCNRGFVGDILSRRQGRRFSRVTASSPLAAISSLEYIAGVRHVLHNTKRCLVHNIFEF